MTGLPLPRKGNSYQGQDLFVLEALRGLRGGFFLDSGASNGVAGSNTLLLESLFGWTGICIEPNAKFFAELVGNRACVCLNCCLYDREEQVDFFEAAGVYGGVMQEYDPKFLRFVQRTLEVREQGIPSTVNKSARTIESVLLEYRAPRVIDYWSLDTEGSEFKILQSFPFDHFRFRVLTVEHNYTSAREKIRVLLNNHGYTRVKSLGIDDCYMWNEGKYNRAWRSRAWARGRLT
jgi:FkbM family methyltransferase